MQGTATIPRNKSLLDMSLLPSLEQEDLFWWPRLPEEGSRMSFLRLSREDAATALDEGMLWNGWNPN